MYRQTGHYPRFCRLAAWVLHAHCRHLQTGIHLQDASVLGYFGLKNLDVTAGVLSALIGLAIIANGLAYILAVVGVNCFEKRVDRLGRIIDIDEQ